MSNWALEALERRLQKERDAAKDAEIERLKVELYDQVEKKQWLDSENRFLKSLITELCDELEGEFGPADSECQSIRPWTTVQRAREATK